MGLGGGAVPQEARWPAGEGPAPSCVWARVRVHFAIWGCSHICEAGGVAAEAR